ncbi:o-succinylbenzoate synthase [Marinoscillum pacificum]|uniref:o-succinylbenzoate synthase n=1 Tax=Marinoscillum pacificum TaxID=392723 RepID=UPI002157447A|nr:o-succinylbenzoate synthase [Marinoscillum pacificum]
MNLESTVRTLHFKFDAGTSRGVLKEHPICLIKVSLLDNPNEFGLGEAAPLEKLSVETIDEVVDFIPELRKRLMEEELPLREEEVYSVASSLVPSSLPSLRFALETAMLDLLNGGVSRIYENKFYSAEKDIPINGLIWMGEPDYMKEQIDRKLHAGYKCIKLKVGAIDFGQELAVLEYLRNKSSSVVIRVDANGGFPTNEVFSRLSELEKLKIHSIEQPIMAGQFEAMQLICKKTGVPVALDEELIGYHEQSRRMELLKLIRPQYIILKPTLLGGLRATMDWIKIAQTLGIGWWLTSALESNVGLNAIAQFAGEFPDAGYQGLGTGQLYENNVLSPLEINGEFLGYNISGNWEKIQFDS